MVKGKDRDRKISHNKCCWIYTKTWLCNTEASTEGKKSVDFSGRPQIMDADLMWTHCDKNCKSGLTRFFFACEWSTSRFMLSIVCKWKKVVWKPAANTINVCSQDISTFVMQLQDVIMENVLLLWTKQMMPMLGFSWHPVERKTQFSFIKTRQFSAKAKR